MLYRGPFSTRFYRRLHGVIHREFRLRRAAGTTAPLVHLARAARRPTSRERLARAKDALLRPFGEAALTGQRWLETRRRPQPARRRLPLA
jgi:anaerobic magnesium-protoporphyrin IX monomethyl ester cyclase